MSLFIHELLKVFLNRKIILLLLSFLLLNGTLLYIQEHGQNVERDPSVYRRVYKDLEGMNSQEALMKLNKEYVELNVIMELSLADSVGEHWEESILERYEIENFTDLIKKEQSGEYLRYTDGIWSEIFLYELVIDEVNDIDRYDSYLEEMDGRAKTLSTISIFSNPDTFSYRNIVKTPRDFDHLRGNKLAIGPSKGVQMATQFLATDLLGVLFLMVVVMQLMTREKEQESLNLIKTTYRGRGRLVITKLSVAVLSSFVMVICFYGINYFLALQTYGFGPMDRYIQSIKGYLSSPFEITVWQYLILFLIVKFLVYSLFSLLFFLVATIAKDSITAYVSIATILGISGIIYTWLPAASIFSFFKYINLFYFLNTYQLFAKYLNLNIFGYPFQYSYCFFITIVVCLSVFSLISYRVFCRQKDLETNSGLHTFIGRLRLPSFGRHVSVFRHEAYKILIVNKILFILLAGIVFQYYTYEPLKEGFTSIDEHYYKYYMLDLEGKLSSDKDEFLVAEAERFADLINEQMRLSGMDDISSFYLIHISEQLAAKNAFDLVLERADYLRSIENEKGIEAWFLYDQGYQLLTAGKDNGRDLRLALLSVILIIACLTPLFTYEMQTKMIRLISPTKHGRGKVFYVKLLLGFLIISFIYILVYIPDLYNVLSTYGTPALQAPIISMQHLSEFPVQMTILQYLIFIYIIRYLAYLLVGLVIYYISVRLKSLITVAIASTAVLALPILLAMIDIQLFNYLLLTPFLLGNVLFKEYTFTFLQDYRFIYGIIAISIFVGSFFVFFKLLRKNYVRYLEN